MLIKKDDLLKVVFYVRAIERFKLHIIKSEKLSDLPHCKQADYSKFSVKYQPLTWKAHNDLRRMAASLDMTTGMRSIDYETYLTNKLKKVIVAWDLKMKDADGEEINIELNDENIENLHPNLAQFLLDYYDKETEVSEHELKNS